MKTQEQINKIQAVVLYILQQFSKGLDYIKLFKLMYFAQREYLAKTGICIVEDTFKARNLGPVPSLTYKVLKEAELGSLSDNENQDLINFITSIEVHNQTVVAKEKPDMDYIAKKEVAELDYIIQKYRNVSSLNLSKISHKDKAYKKVCRLMKDDPQKDTITIIDIARSGGATNAMIDHIREVQLIKESFKEY